MAVSPSDVNSVPHWRRQPERPLPRLAEQNPLMWFAHTARPSVPEVGVGTSKAGKREAALPSPVPALTASRAKLTRGRM